ncbi:NAD(P)H-binding protein [Paucihalobacter sp.]|uniref:NAD(P)H-binding protein n=1 Tax=Paucihalobacter sp. TaxID=2850405 RepID=UPI002FE1838D
MNKTAIILGATGLTGSLLLDNLLNNDAYAKVIVFSRSKIEISHPKLEILIIDLFKISEHQDDFKAQVVFCCIGSTKAKTPDESVYKSIDYGIPVSAAKLCKLNNIPTFIVVSSLGANPKSNMFYNRIKGEMERDVLNLNIENTFILQPSLIDGRRDELRIFEWLWQKAMRLINGLLIGKLRKYRSIKAETISDAMVILDLNGYKNQIIESHQIKELVKNA